MNSSSLFALSYASFFFFPHSDKSHEISSCTSMTTIHSPISFQRIFFIPRGQSKEMKTQVGRKSGEGLNRRWIYNNFTERVPTRLSWSKELLYWFVWFSQSLTIIFCLMHLWCQKATVAKQFKNQEVSQNMTSQVHITLNLHLLYPLTFNLLCGKGFVWHKKDFFVFWDLALIFYKGNMLTFLEKIEVFLLSDLKTWEHS